MKKKNGLFKVVLFTGILGLSATALTGCVSNKGVLNQESETATHIESTLSDMSAAKNKLIDLYTGNDDNMLHYVNTYVENMAPALTCTNAEGIEINIISEAKSRGGVFVEFMAPWCPACVESIPDLENISNSTGKDVISLAVGSNGFDELSEFISKNDVSNEVYLASNYEEIDDYSVQFIPIMFYIDESGIVKGIFMPHEDIEVIEDIINS